MNESKGIVFNIQHYSLQDGPGIRTTVFLKGCPLRCRWCCNPESQSMNPEKLGEKLCGKLMTVKEVITEVQKDEPFYRYGRGGMTISGGEPLNQGEFLIELLKEAKRNYLYTAIETSGFGEEGILIEAAKYLDTIYYDIKSLDNDKHKEWTGVSNEKIIKNLKKLKEIYPEKIIHIRTPVIPGFNDTVEDIKNICDFLRQLENVDYEILPYHFYGRSKYELLNRIYIMGDAKLEEGKINELKGVIDNYGLGV